MARKGRTRDARQSAVDRHEDLDVGHLYARIRDEIAGQIASGKLKPGTKLPTVRALATERSINPMTVARAYRELAAQGLVNARPGSGSYVAEPARIRRTRTPAMPPSSLDPGSITSRLFELARAPGVIAFTGNYPSVENSDAASFTQCLREELAAGATDFYRYDPPAGREELREALLPFLATHSIHARANDIIVTSGGQQGMDIVARQILSPGDRVVLALPAYFGAINVVRAARAVPVPLRLGPDGFDLDEAAALIRKHAPRLMIIDPTFQNPTGRCIPLDQRRGLLALAIKTGVLILEDDHSPEMRFRGVHIPPLRSLSGGDQQVYYTRGFGKTFVPGIRLGFLLPPAGALADCLEIKATTDLQSPALPQGALARYLSTTDWPGYLKRLCAVYGVRQRQLFQILMRTIGGYGDVMMPDGGLNLWIEIAKEINVREVYFNAVRRGVAFAVSDSFSFNPDGPSALRVAFGLTDPQDFEEGACRLANVLRSVTSPRVMSISAVV